MIALPGYKKVTIRFSSEPAAIGRANAWKKRDIKHVKIEKINDLYVLTGYFPDGSNTIITPTQVWYPGKT